ncbi:DUF3243 domain-containing protein [Sporosarcina sp. BI001-red]|uniref:DUF3243 domain-containing protein n=1 Tax=Sporosarcina sp. BI001-red TaxID=2282866 RepID=UPI000E285163|nr:DUF3243 domain-containing protein [Sporosarcina sp. BI001-red]REB06071.1 DUF3243 domain-containing protein [Sporosarcina sp. BI001-red]
MDVKGKVEGELNKMDSEKKEDILKNFSSFKEYLSDKVNKGEKLGLSDEQLTKATEYVAGYLAKHEEPKNREQYVLQELWKVGDKEEQKALSSLLFKLVKAE